MSAKSISEILTDPDSSTWLKEQAAAALLRDPIDAARDAQLLELALRDRAEQSIAGVAVR